VGWPEWRLTEVMAARPQVRVNQLGYLLDRPKYATLVSDAKDPLHFTVRDQSGIAVFTDFPSPGRFGRSPRPG
jgi:hypothetical protein